VTNSARLAAPSGPSRFATDRPGRGGGRAGRRILRGRGDAGAEGGMDWVSGLDWWLIVVVPLVGLAIAVLVLQVYGREDPSAGSVWRTFPRGAVRADITGDVVDSAGEEERFPWRLVPIRTVAILATVGLGGAMGTEAPAVYLGVGAGACVGDRGGWWRRLLRPAALAGGGGGRVGADGDPAGRDHLHARAGTPAKGGPELRAGGGGADRRFSGLGNRRRVSPRADSSGGAQGAAGEPGAGGGDRAVHRGGFRSHHRDGPGRPSIARRSGRRRRRCGC
jgi:hypothetical protein